jgi:hypothetical protein
MYQTRVVCIRYYMFLNYKAITYGARFRARKHIDAIELLMDRGKLRSTVKTFLADPELQKPRSLAERVKTRRS